MLLTLTIFPFAFTLSSIYRSHHSGNLWKRLVHESMERWRAIQPRERPRVTAVLIQSKSKLC